MPATNPDRQQFNLYLDRDIVRALKLRCIQEDRRLNHYVEDIFAAVIQRGLDPTTVKTAAAMPTTSLATVIVCVDDMTASVALYRDHLGLPCRQTGNRWTEFDAGGYTLALHIQDEGGAAKANGVVILDFKVADLAATCATLRAAGYAVEGPREMAGLGLMAKFTDPDGVRVTLSQASAA